MKNLIIIRRSKQLFKDLFNVKPIICLIGFIFISAILTQAQPGSVLSSQKISDLKGTFTGTLDDYDYFGVSVTCIGDLDNDGVNDIVAGSNTDDDGGTDRGAIWVLFLNSNGTVKSHQKISSTQGNFSGTLNDGDGFGVSVCNIGDINHDGTTDLAVGSSGDDDGGPDKGAIWVLFMDPSGNVQSYQKISSTQGNFAGVLNDGDYFSRISTIGDFNSDGVNDLVVGATNDADGGTPRGAIWVIFLTSTGKVLSFQKISSTQGNFTGILDDGDKFGNSIALIGDMDSDGVDDIIVGAHRDDDKVGGGPPVQDRGAEWVLFMNPGATVKGYQKISDTQGNFTGGLAKFDFFGQSVTSIGDMDGDGVTDVSVGAEGDDDGGTQRGAIWNLFLNSNGTVKSYQKISDLSGNFSGNLSDNNFFGASVANIGDINGDGISDLAVGARGDGDGGAFRGAVWILFMDGNPLPIELMSFNAILNGGKVDLTWATATEFNNDYFTVLRSTDGKNFNESGKVKGAGNSSKEVNYSFTDEKPLQGISYYRLMHTDLNGRNQYHVIKSVNNETPGTVKINIFPNPVSNSEKLFIEFNDEINNADVTIVMLDQSGKVVFSGKAGMETNNQRSIIGPFSTLSPGIYHLIADNNEEIYKSRLVIK